MFSKYLSKTLRAVAYLWIGFPAVYPLYAAVGLNVDVTGLVRIALSPLFWFVSLVSMIAALGVLRVKWYGWYLFLASNFFIAYQNALVLTESSQSDYRFALFAVTLIFQAALVFIVGREIRVPYFFPRIRWWESDPRYKLSLQAKITRHDKSEIEGLIMDISLGGCFIKTHAHLTNDEVVDLDFTFFESPLKCRGRVVWTSESTVTHPKGIGLKFLPLTRDTAFTLRHGVRKMHRLARVYTQIARERNFREYLAREQRYQGKTKK